MNALILQSFKVFISPLSLSIIGLFIKKDVYLNNNPENGKNEANINSIASAYSDDGYSPKQQIG
jgi:hypothetical protein